MRGSATLVGAVSLLWFTFPSQATGGGTLKDPVQDYLHLGDHEQAVELLGLKGISVLELDVDGDGKAEMFISADGYGGRLGNIWTVYLSRENGFERLSSPSKDVMFRSDMFYVGEIETPDGRMVQGLLAYYPGKGGGDLAIYQLANDYMVRTSLGSLNLEDKSDRAFWDRYFAGPSEDQPYRSVIEHPVKHETTKELAERGYDLSAVHQLNAIRENDLKSPKTPASESTSATVSSTAGPTESSSRSPEPTTSPRTFQNEGKKAFWIVIVIVILSAAALLYLKKRRSIGS